jgi:hypothetical protein
MNQLLKFAAKYKIENMQEQQTEAMKVLYLGERLTQPKKS